MFSTYTTYINIPVFLKKWIKDLRLLLELLQLQRSKMLKWSTISSWRSSKLFAELRSFEPFYIFLNLNVLCTNLSFFQKLYHINKVLGIAPNSILNDTRIILAMVLQIRVCSTRKLLPIQFLFIIYSIFAIFEISVKVGPSKNQ